MKTFKSAVLEFLPITALIFCGCSSVQVATHYDHTVPFGSYHTYAVEPPKDAHVLSATADSALRASLQQKLAERGIREVSPGANPDLAVVPRVKLEQKYSVRQYTDWGDGGYGMGTDVRTGVYYGVWSGPPVTYRVVKPYNEGILILDFVDTSNQRLVFRGTGTTTIANIEDSAKKIDEAAKKIVAEFPASPTPMIARNP